MCRCRPDALPNAADRKAPDATFTTSHWPGTIYDRLAPNVSGRPRAMKEIAVHGSQLRTAMSQWMPKCWSARVNTLILIPVSS